MESRHTTSSLIGILCTRHKESNSEFKNFYIDNCHLKNNNKVCYQRVALITIKCIQFKYVFN